MKHEKLLRKKREQRKTRVRAAIAGDASRPRLAVFRSNKATYAQLIDDRDGKTLVSASRQELGKGAAGKKKIEIARMVGELIAKKAKEKGITRATLDRRSYAYHGRVRALAEGARAGGLKI